MWLRLSWIDNRLKIETKNGSRRGVIMSTDEKVTSIRLQSRQILHQIWVPEVIIPHQKLSKLNHGPGYRDEVLAFVLKDENVWVDYWSWIKPTITCPLTFNWYPFDQQNCLFVLQV
jgi:hypothetical protein